jgi:lipopolysaccharide transport system ATP-binding protein
MTTDSMLEVQGVYKKFRRGELYNSLRDLLPAMTRRLVGAQELDRREFWALQDVSFTVRRGEAFGVIGANGAGKSTILKLLTGIMRPTAGTICAAGRISALIEVGAGFHPDLTGRENIYLNGAILGMTRDEITQRFDAIVAFSGLEDFIDTPVKRYSSGMYARLGFSVAAHVDPEVLIVDEVLSVGDYLFQLKCVERMNSVIAGGATVIFVSHNLHAVANLCQRSLLLEGGRVQTIGPTADVISTYYNRVQQRREVSAQADIAITRVDIQDETGPRVQFNSGGQLRITVEARARIRREDIRTVIQIVDDHQYPLFDTCTYRLGAGALVLGAGQTLTSTFDLDLNLGHGTFHVNVFLRRCATPYVYDRWLSASTFFVTSAEAHGAVRLAPKLAACSVRDASDQERTDGS